MSFSDAQTATSNGLPVLQRLGPYQILQHVGQGGMADVYRAYDTKNQYIVAVKILSALLAADPNFRKRFEHEAKTVAMLKHDNIVQVLDSGEFQGTYYIVMEYIGKEDLNRHLRKNGPLPLSFTQHMLREVANALDYAHSKGVVHRDIKPSNVLLLELPNSSALEDQPLYRAILTDFGIAKIPDHSYIRTETGALVGSLPYMAPEQIADSKQVGKQADIYSLGVMLYQMLTGELPFIGNNLWETIDHIKHQPVPDPRQVISDIPEHIAAAVQKALAKNPDQRFSSAGALIDALEPNISAIQGLSLNDTSKAVIEPVNPEFTLPLLIWCAIPEGEVIIRNRSFGVRAFHISKYPVTNDQFDAFVNAPDGYTNDQWWNFSQYAIKWRQENPHPVKPRFPDSNCPREEVCWYEAVAFCRWLSMKTGLSINLPSEQQWKLAASGGDNRAYPWGDTPDVQKCNVFESNFIRTTLVDYFPTGASPYGVLDMAGNVLEWCLTEYNNAGNDDITTPEARVLHGGSWLEDMEAARIITRDRFFPDLRDDCVGFRLAIVS